jgi:hypothetical protein
MRAETIGACGVHLSLSDGNSSLESFMIWICVDISVKLYALYWSKKCAINIFIFYISQNFT